MGDPNADYSTVDACSALDCLLPQCIATKQKLDGDSVVLKYNDHRNNKEATFVRVPRNISEAAALKQCGFWEKMHGINGIGDVTKSVKRASKHFKKHFADAFNEVLNEEGISSHTVMEAYKVAAMFKDGGVTAKRRRRRALLCILKNQFGKKAFAPEYQADIMCEGYSKVHVDKIEYQYEFGYGSETLHYYEKNIAKGDWDAAEGRHCYYLLLSLSLFITLIYVWFTASTAEQRCGAGRHRKDLMQSQQREMTFNLSHLKYQ